ncbi:MAG: GFA family protein, partial [Terriglobia bacterium]
VPTDSGKPHQIFRCPECQTPLWSIYGGRSAIRFVRIGTLDRPSAIAPDVHIYVRSKQPWVSLPSGSNLTHGARV